MTVLDPYLSLIPQAIAEIECGGETHQLAWAGGRFTTLDHLDPEGERTLAALGGTRNACVDHLDAWHRHHHDLRVLTLASRGPSDPLGWEEPGARPVMGSRKLGRITPGRIRGRSSASYSTTQSGWLAPRTAMGSVGQPIEPEDDYTTLLGLGGGLPDRLSATVAAHWSECLETEPPPTTELAALRAALFGRVWLAVRAWAGDPSLDVNVTMIDPDDEPTLSRSGRHVAVSLPFRWLSRVWAPQLAVTAGRFVIDATRDGESLALTTVDGTSSSTIRMAL